MRKKRVFPQTVKRIFHPEVKHCLDCGSRLRRSVTISERTVITLTQVRKARPLWISLSGGLLSRQQAALSEYGSGCAGLTRLYLWAGYPPAGGATATERAPKGG